MSRTKSERPKPKRRIVTPPNKGRQTIQPDSPLDQYGSKPRAAYNAYVTRVGGSLNAISFEDFRSLWDDEQGESPSPTLPPQKEGLAQLAQEQLPLREMTVSDPTTVYQPSPHTIRNEQRTRPQRVFGIFTETDEALWELANRDRRAIGPRESAHKNDWMEAAILLMLEESKRDPELYERWQTKARSLRAISLQAQVENRSLKKKRRG